MNNILRQYARKRLKEDLVVVGLFDHRMITYFKQMYSHSALDVPVDNIVDSMDDHQLDIAMGQVHRTMVKYSLAESV